MRNQDSPSRTTLLLRRVVLSRLQRRDDGHDRRQLQLFPPSSVREDAASLLGWDCVSSPPGWLLIRDGRIAAMAEGEPPAGLDAKRTADLDGAHLGPSFADNHLHLLWIADALGRISLHGSRSLEEALERIREGMAPKETSPGGADESCTRSAGDGLWLRGGGWNKNLWASDHFPDARDLDAVCPDRPAAFESQDLHSIWLNTAALRRLGIDAHGPDDPPGGRIDRDDSGRPTGLLRETAVKLATERIPPPEDALRLRLLPRAYRSLSEKGITTVTDLDGLEALALHRKLGDGGPLPLEIVSAVRREELDLALRLGLRTGQRQGPCTVGPHKLFADGAFISQTALLLEPYRLGRQDLGIQATSTKDLDEAMARALGGGLAVAVHAIGDGAVRLVLDLFHRHRRKGGGVPSPRFRLEHVQLAHPDDMARMAELDLAVSVQPLHQPYDAPLVDRHLGPRASIAYPFASLTRAGVPLLFGSDAPVAEACPIKGLWAAVHRPAYHPDHAPDGASTTSIPSWRPEERLPLSVALSACSVGGRCVLREGDPADLVVLDRAPGDVAHEALRELEVLATLRGGRVCHAAASCPDLSDLEEIVKG